MARTIKPLKQANIAAAIQADDAARKAKSAAKRAATAAAKAAAKQALIDQRTATEQAARAERNIDAENAAALQAQSVDYEALTELPAFGDDGQNTEGFTAYLTEQGYNVDGSTGAVADRKQREQTYFGPMLALKTARLTYVKAANGIQCNGDEMALTLGALNREQVVAVLIAAMKLEGNPYTHLNPGQQSMNLRNKARAQVKNGLIKLADIAAAVAAVTKA